MRYRTIWTGVPYNSGLQKTDRTLPKPLVNNSDTFILLSFILLFPFPKIQYFTDCPHNTLRGRWQSLLCSFQTKLKDTYGNLPKATYLRSWQMCNFNPEPNSVLFLQDHIDECYSRNYLQKRVTHDKTVELFLSERAIKNSNFILFCIIY